MDESGAAQGATVRVSDAEREAAATELREHCGDGRLTLDELSERLETTFAARTREELGRALVDLPRTPVPAGPARELVGSAQVTPSTVRRRSVGWTISMMSCGSHRGRWRPKGVTNVVALMGTCELDLCQAEIDGPEVVINAVSVMGHIDVVVPEGIEVELTGINIMGCKELLVRPVPPIPGAPTIRVRGFILMGDVMVRSKKGHGGAGDQYPGLDPPPTGDVGWSGPATGLGMGGARIARDALRRERRERHNDRRASRSQRRGW